MSAEINLARVIRQLPEIRAALYENRKVVLWPAATILGCYLLKDHAFRALDSLHSFIYKNYWLEGIDEALLPFRTQMSHELRVESAKDPHPHNDDTLRILEIGMGPGSSLQFYPRDSRVIGLDCSPYFVSALKKLQVKYPNLAKVILGQAEDLDQITDESVDVVVSTLVLCSVQDLDKAVREVKRVLVKGGKFYFFEHQACQVSWSRYLAQLVLNGLLSMLMNGCNVSRRITESIERNGFEMTNVTYGLGFRTWIGSSHAFGYATKP